MSNEKSNWMTTATKIYDFINTNTGMLKSSLNTGKYICFRNQLTYLSENVLLLEKSFKEIKPEKENEKSM